ncbi:MAG TPA: DNA polymerase IV [Steroidobacteraceae bacterium]|nr:DNA polymerase IV [Steroidobacteraceae bacterium]
MSSNKRRAILHVDMDAFYASVEEQDRPELKGLPLIVGGSGARSVVAAASYAVRKFGVHSAMPMGRALQLCPTAVCVPPRMARYAEVSAIVFDVFHEVTPQVEGLSLDEAFLDVTDSMALLGEPRAIALSIKQRIRDRTGLTATVGVASNKLVAKIASDLNKPDGLNVVTDENLHATLDPLPVTRLPGLGRKKGAAVLAAGIATLGELRAAPDARLWPLFGRDSAAWRARAAGLDDRAVQADRDEKSVSAEETFDTDLDDPQRLRSELLRLSDRTCARLRAKGLVAGCVTLKIRQHDFSTHSRQRRLVPPTQDSRAVGTAAAELLDAWLREHSGSRLRLLGVGGSELVPLSQPDLFAPPQPPPDQRLDAAVDQIRSRYGSSAMIRAGNLPDRRK